MKCGLLYLSQESCLVGEVSYHSYEGILIEGDERDRIAKNLGVHNKVWSLTQVYSVDFSKSRIGVKKCVFNKRKIKVCVSAVFDSVFDKPDGVLVSQLFRSCWNKQKRKVFH